MSYAVIFYKLHGQVVSVKVPRAEFRNALRLFFENVASEVVQ